MDNTLEAKGLDLGPLVPLTAETTGSNNLRMSQFLFSSARAGSINTSLPPGKPKISPMLPFCIALQMTPPLGELAGVSEKILNLCVHIYRASGLSVVKPALLILGEKDWCLRLGFSKHFIAHTVGPLSKHVPLLSCKQN